MCFDEIWFCYVRCSGIYSWLPAFRDILRCVTSRKSEYLIYTGQEAESHANLILSPLWLNEFQTNLILIYIRYQFLPYLSKAQVNVFLQDWRMMCEFECELHCAVMCSYVLNFFGVIKSGRSSVKHNSGGTSPTFYFTNTSWWNTSSSNSSVLYIHVCNTARSFVICDCVL